MSSITVIKVRDGSFVSIECLEESLNQLGLMNYVKIIRNEEGLYQLAYEKRVTAGHAEKTRERLHSSLQKIIEQITPLYTEKLAIKELENKGFIIKDRKSFGKELTITMERTKPLTQGGKPEKYAITIHANNRVTLDAINFTGRTCLNVSNKLEKKLGSIVRRDLKPEAQISTKGATRLVQKRRLRI